MPDAMLAASPLKAVDDDDDGVDKQAFLLKVSQAGAGPRVRKPHEERVPVVGVLGVRSWSTLSLCTPTYLLLICLTTEQLTSQLTTQL